MKIIANPTNLQMLWYTKNFSKKNRSDTTIEKLYNKFKIFRYECNAIFRSRYSDLTKEERKNLLISVAK